jgi:hypothetical protein
MNARQACHTTPVASHAEGLIKGLYKSPELVIIAILQADMGFWPEVVAASHSCEIE